MTKARKDRMKIKNILKFNTKWFYSCNNNNNNKKNLVKLKEDTRDVQEEIYLMEPN